MTLVPPTPIIMPTHPTWLPLIGAPLSPYNPSQLWTPSPLNHRSTCYEMISPKYDLVEFPDYFCLCGEVPGVQQDDIEIEFTNPQTMTIRGKSERSYHSEVSSVGGKEGVIARSFITGIAIASCPPEAITRNTNTANDGKTTTGPSVLQAEVIKRKYWLSERSFGEFGRSFNFDFRVDQDNVQTSLKNGLLTIIIPKSRLFERRKINVSVDAVRTE